MPSILVVDDEDQIRHLIRETLEQAGYHITEACDGKEALQQYRLAPADLVIMDILMPNQDGLEATVALRREFPDVKVIAEWPDVALPPIGIDRYTAFVALTHDPKIDDPGLALALKSDCFYIGALGSRKTHARRVERLKTERGFTDNDIGRIHSPIGLDIGAVSPAEIAVAIMGEITQRLRQESP